MTRKWAVSVPGALVEDLRAREIRPAMAILGEPTMMRVINGHKGCYEYTTHITGCAGHGSAPDHGVNAAVCAARYAGRLMELEGELRTPRPRGQPVFARLDHAEHWPDTFGPRA